MKTKLLTVEVIKVQCKGITREKYKLGDFTYGERLLVTKDGLDYVYIDCINDVSFNEIVKIVNTVLADKNMMIQQEGVNQILGLLCDPINGKVLYAKCSFLSFGDYTEEECSVEESNPPLLKEIEVPYVTFDQWNTKSSDEKIFHIRKLLHECEILP